jgi:hypothetical protein
MPSSRRHRAKGLVALILAAGAVTSFAKVAGAQQQAQGFALERFYPSAPGGGWFVMDDLDLRGGLGGAAAMTVGYARAPLVVKSGSQSLAVVSEQAFADFGFAITYERFRLYMNLDAPLVVHGDTAPGGTIIGNTSYTSPALGLGGTPDTLADARFGFDVRLLGTPRSRFRLGAGAQIFVPTAKQSDYDTDGTVRSMIRLLAAGDLGCFTYAGQLGVYVRPLDDASTPGSPQGSELLFGAAAGLRLPVAPSGHTALVVGPEAYGETAFRSFFGSATTGLEGLFSARVEGTRGDGPELRVKLGAGGGIDANFGAPDWRVVFGIEVFDHSGDRDHDGVTDSHDACPDTPGVKSHDPYTNGCPFDRDHDGVTDAEDACPDVPGPRTGDATTNGCPAPAAPAK